MNRTIIIFVVAAMVLVSLVFWAMDAKMSGSLQEIMMLAVALIVVGFAIVVGITRAKCVFRRYPTRDSERIRPLIPTESDH